MNRQGSLVSMIPGNVIRALCLPPIALLVFVAGCSSGGPDMVDVSGTVTRNGQPVPNIDVYFQPTEGRPSLGTTDAQGRFTMQYTHDQSGVRVGNHTVYVIFNPNEGSGTKAPSDLGKILAKYGTPEKSPIKLEVKKALKDVKIELD
jgi:hypothetical protein